MLGWIWHRQIVLKIDHVHFAGVFLHCNIFIDPVADWRETLFMFIPEINGFTQFSGLVAR
jgi:hypothetical protein